MLKSVEIERAVAPIIAKCLDGIEKAAGEINEKEDIQLVIERYKSGFQPPGDFPFEDLSAAKMQIDGNSKLSTPVMQPITNHLTIKGTMSGGKMKKRMGLLGIFSSNKVKMDFNLQILLFFMFNNRQLEKLEDFIFFKYSWGFSKIFLFMNFLLTLVC